jgi:protocatechuate 3,4-dioxygenase beta subunit
VQEADSSGRVQFTSVFPGCYAGRWPHIHFEVYPTLTAAGSVANRIATSQIALPKDVSDQVYATSGYTASASNLSQISLASDMVFSDGAALELATMSGSVSGGLVAMLSVAVNA